MLKYKELPFINDLIAGKKCWVKEDIYLKMLTDLKSVQDAIKFYFDVATKYSPFSQFKIQGDPKPYYDELMALDQVILDDHLSFAAYNKEGELVAFGAQQDYTSQVVYPEHNSFIMKATEVFLHQCVDQLLTSADLKDIKRGQVAYSLIGSVNPKYQGSGILDITYQTLFQLNRAKGYKYTLSETVTPKMITYLVKLATHVYVGKYTISKFEDFEFQGQRPLRELKFFSKDYGVDDGMMALLIDNFQPKVSNKDVIAKL